MSADQKTKRKMIDVSDNVKRIWTVCAKRKTPTSQLNSYILK